MAMAFADLLNKEARALEADGVDVIQFDEPASTFSWTKCRPGVSKRSNARSMD
jgi:methionine synthase II (cobalamin-independent)